MPSASLADRWASCGLIASTCIVAGGCRGLQSTLDPAGHQARMIAHLWWWMLGGAVVIWLIMMALSYYAIFAQRGRHYQRITAAIVIGGGVIFPALILTILLCFGLSMLNPLLARAPAGSIVIDVEGVQWWWRVNYSGIELGERENLSFETANEICIPVDQPVEFHLRTHDVIHTFWIPALAGKVDMIPGRVTRMTVNAFRTGRFRGACAEYCGDSHALMNFDVRVVTAAEYEKWLTYQVSAAADPQDDVAERGRVIFHSRGCGACHTIRGSQANGTVGPDLTHFAGRLSLGAGVYANDHASIMTWLRSTEHVKPGVHMPNFGMLSERELDDLASYLRQLP